jgi:DNA-binding CsgD family transcriptional regulator
MVLSNAGGDMPHHKLSSREMDVFKMLMEGASLDEIAEQLSISYKTVGAHKMHVLEKIGVKNMVELVRYAVQHNLFS